MNKIFKVIWSKSKQCYIVVSEIAKNKTGKKKIVVAGIFAALSLIGHLQPVQAIDGAGDKAGFSNAASGVNFDSTKGIAIGLKNGDKTSANGNVATVAIGAHSNASGSSSVAIGGAVVDGAGAIGLGWSTAKGNNAVALGGTGLTNANGNNAFAASGGNANGESATAIGSSAIASGRGGVAVGWNSQSAVNAVGIGFNAKAKSNNTVAIGVEANSDNSIGDNSSSVSIGVKTRAREVGSMAMGVSADASGKYSIALGSGNVSGDYTATANYPKATGEKAIAIGYNSNSSNTGATAIGAGATASGTDSFAGGSGTAGGNSSIAIGKGASITAPIAGTTFGGQDSIAMGTGASAKQHSSVTIGVDSTSDGVRNITIGPKASASGVDSIAIGNGGVGGDKNNTGVGGNGNTYTIDVNGISTNVYYGVKSVDNGSIAFGNRANAAKGGLAIGTVSIADGGIAVGQSVLSKNGVAIGSAVSATAANAVALGSRAEASSVGAVAIGGYSVTDKTKAQGNNALAIGASAVTNGNETIAIGKSANASNSNAVAVGKNANASIANSVAIGSDSTTDTNATRQANTTINGITYNFAGATSDTGMQVSVGAAGKERQIKNVAAGEVSAISTDAINGSQLFAVASQIKPQLKYVSIKSDTELDNANNDGATADKAIAIGPIAKASSKSAVAIGNTSIASSENAIAIGNNSNSSGVDSVAIGPSSVSNNVGSVAVGKDAQANGAFTVALGGGNWQNKGAQANGVGTIALGTYTRTKESTNYQTAVGFESKTDAESATAIGYQAVASGKDSVALGTGASTTGQDALTFGHNSQANGNSSLAMGLGAQANSNNAIALGYQTNSNSTNSTNGVFIGSVAGKETNGVGNIGIGSNTGNKIIGDNNVSIGTGAGSVTATNVYASESIMLGTQARAINSTSTSPINNVIAIGKGSSGGANSTIAIGQNASSTNQNSIAIGTNASAPAYNGVAIGSFSVANTEGGTVEGYNANASRTDKYAGLTGAVLKGNIGAVSIGSGGTMTRQIKNLAAGTADTDAVNVAQLKSVNLAFKGNTGAGGDVNLAANPLTIKGNDSYITTNASGNTITISANQKDIHVISGTANADTGVANAKNVATAINDAISQNKYKWYLTADNDTAGSRSTIDKEGTVKFSGDPNITVARSGNTITSSLNKIITVDTVKASKSVIAGSGNDQITLDGTSGTVTGRNFSGQSFAAGNNVLSNTTLQIGSATNGDNNVTISRDGFSSKAGTKTAKFGATGIDAGGQVITNVSSGGNVGTNAANITDVKNYVGKVALNIQSNSKTGTINLEQGALGVTGANGIRTDLGGTGNSNLVIGLDKNTVNATTNGIGLSSDSGTMLRKFLKDGNADFKISGDGALVSTSGTTTGVQVSIDKSKVKDLAVEAVTVSKANTVDNPITVTSTAGTNSKEYAIGIDTSKLAAKTEVTYRANNAADANAKKVSLSKGLNFVDGDSTVATVDNDGKVSFDLNTATKNQINTNTTDIAANKGKIATNTTNIAANTTAIARNISLGADTGTASRQSLSTADVAFNVKGSTGDFVSTNMNGNTVEISTTRATINSDANTGTASVTGNDGLATAKNVADAINKAADAAKAGSAWNVSTNGDTSTKVSGGDTVDFTGDNNITVDRNNKTISTSLNKNLTDMNSISLGNPRGETIFLNGRDGSIKAGKAEFKDNVGAGSTITSDQLSFTNGATGANEATTTIALDTVSIQSGPNNSALTSKYLMFSDEDGNNAEGSAKGMGFQNAAGKTVQFSLDEIKAGGNKIQEVAEGTADTDAVNVKQLKDTVASQTLTYRANTAADADAKSVKLSKGLDFVDGTSTVATVDNDGKVSFDLNTATKTKIDDSATAVARKISLGADSGTVSSQSLKDGDVAFNVKGATGDFVSTKMNGNTVEISTTRATINSDANTGAASVTGNDGLATAKNVADAINKAADAAKAGAAWNLTTNSSTTDKTSVQGGDTVDFINGDNILITQDGTDKKKITVATKKDLTVDSVTAGNTVINTSGLTNGTTAITGSGITTDKVTVGGISIDKTDGINAGGKTIANVASGGTTDTNAANIGDVKQAVANLSQNLNITDGTNNGTVDLKNQKLNVAGANGVTATVNNQTITVGLDADTVNATTKGIGLTADTGATGNKYLKDGDVSFAVTGDGNLVSTSATTAGVKVAVDAAKVKDLAIDAVTVSKAAQADNPITVTPTVGANSKDYAIGIDTTKLAGKTDLTYRANNDTDANAKKVSLAKGLNFVNGTLATASIDNDGAVKYDVNTATITAGTDGTVTGPTTDGVATAQNVADAINAAKKASKTEITANTGEAANATTGNVTLTSTTAADGHTIYDVKLNDKVTLGTATNAVTIDGTTGKVTAKNAGIGGITVDGDNKHVTGLSNTTWNGTATTGRAATEDQLKAVADTAKATTDAVNLKFSGDTNTAAGVVNLKDDTFNIVGDGKYVTTDANGKDLTVKVSEAEVKKSAVAAVTVSTDTTDANNPISVTPTTSADGTTKDYKVTIDGTKIANKTNLSYKANDGTAKQVSLAEGLNFKNGTLTTASIDDNGVVKYDVNTAAITTGADGTITGPTTDGVATAKNVADAINAAKKASKTEVTANTGEAANATTGNVSLTSTTAADGHTIYDVKLNDKVTLGTGANAVTIDGTTGAITGKTATIGGVTVNGTANTIGGLSNTTWNGTATTGRAATEDQLKVVADAAGSQTWEITADKKAGTSGVQTGTKENAKVGKDDTVSLIAGENLTVDQASKNFTYSLNKDLVKMNSATFEATGGKTTVIKGDSIVQTDGANVNTTNATSNTITDGTNTSTITAGKAQIGTVGIDGVASKITTGGTNAVVVNGADGTVKTGTVTVTGGTTNDITGLSNTTLSATDFATKGRAATEEQLKAATGATTLKVTGDVATNTGSINLRDDTFGIKGDGKYISTDVNGKNVNLTVSEAEVKKSAVAAVTVSTDTTDANNPLTVTPTTSADGTTKDYKVTIDGTKIANKTNLSYKANNGTAKQVSLADGLNFKNGTLTTASIDDNGVVKYDVNTASITAGADGTITGPTTDGVATAQNVADAINTAKKASKTEITANTGEAANATTGNVTLTSTTAADGHTIYDVKLNDKVTLGTGANAVTIDGTAGKATIGSSIVDGVNNTFITGGASPVTLNGATGTITGKTANIGGVTVNGTANTIGGLSNTTWNGTATTGRAATEDQLKAVADTAKTTTDAVNLKFSGDTNTSPGVVNLKDDTLGIIGDGKYVSTDANGKNLTVKVSEAEVKKSAVAAVTVSTDTTDANNPLTVTPTTSADGTTKDYKVTIDGTKIANKTNLSYKANDGTAKQVSLADGLNFKNGTLTTASIDDNGVVKYDVNTASIAVGTDGTITGPTTDGVATAQNVTDAINAAKKASKTEITANTGEAANATTGNVTLTSTTAADGHTIYDVKLNDKVTLGTGANAVTVDGTTGKVTIGSSIVDGVNNTFTTGGVSPVTLNGATGTITGKTANIGGVTVNGTANIIGGLSNTTWNGTATTGRAATEDQLKAVADAAGSQTWEITADKKTGTSGAQTGTKENAKVGKDDKVSLIAGENLTVDQAGKNFTYSLNTDLVKMNSATFLGTGANTTVITGDSITQTAGTQTNTSTADGNTVADGTKSTKTTADGQVIKDGAKSNKSTVDNNVIDDGNGNVNTSNATSNTITDGTNTTATTSSSVTVKDNAGNSTVITKDNVTTGVGANKITLDGTAGKATIGSSIVDGVNNTFTTGGANAVTMNGAAGTVKTGTVTVTGGTTNDITGLSNTTVNSADFATKGRAATEEQLKAATGATTLKFTGDVATNTGSVNLKDDIFGIKGDGKYISTDVNGKNVNLTVSEAEVKKSAVAAVTVSTDTTDANNPLTVTPTTSADGTTKDYKVTIDGTKIANKTNLSYKANNGTAKQVSLADGLDFTNGTLTTASIDDKGVVKYDVNTASITAGTDGTITGPTTDGVATAKNVADAINAAKKASKTEITANTGEAANATTGNVSLTSTTAADGHTIYDVKLNDKVTLGTGANAVTIDGTAGKATIGSSIVDGVNNTFTTGGASPVTLNGATGTITGKTANIGGVTVDGTNNHVMGLANKDWTPGVTQAVSGRAATEDQLQKVSDAVGAGWKVNTGKITGSTGESNGAASTKVASGEEVQFQAGNNLIVDQNGKTVAYSLNKALKDLESATFNGTGTNKTVITGDSITQTARTQTNTSTAAGNTVANGANSTATTAAGTTVTTANGNTNYAADGVRINTTGKTPVLLTDAGLDNGNNVIKNVASGHVNNDATDNTNAANIADVKKATTTVTANAGEVANATTGNVTLTSTAAADGHTIYDVKLNDKVTLGTGANAVMIDGTAGKATVGTAVVDGVNNIITTGGASPVTLNGATGTIIGKTANIGGVTVDGTNNHVMGLANKDWTPGVTQAVSGRAATEDQLQKVSDAVGAGWKVNTGKVTGSTGESNGAASTKVASGEEVQFQAGNNLIVDQNGKTVAYSLNKALKDLESATFNGAGTNKTVITGDSITQTAGTQTNTSTAAGNTVADGTKSTKTTADGQVIKDGTKTNTSTVDENTIVDGAKSNKTTVDSNVINDGNGNVNTSNATSNTITDGTNTVATTSSSVTVKDNAGNSTVITKDNITTGVGANKIILDGAAGTIKTGTVTVTGGTTNDITGLSNTTVTATDFATKGRAATEEQLKAVGEQTWQIMADKKTGTSGAQTGLKENAKVGKDDKVSLIAGENLTVDQAGKNFTYSLNSDLVKMNSATFLGTGTNTTVITGDSITQTAGSQTNTSTAGGNTVADGTKSTEITAAGQVIKDGAKSNKSTVDKNVIDDGTGNVNTSNATSNTITDGTNTSTIAAGKATIGSSIIDGVNNTFTTGGASPVTLDGATGTITGKTANIGGVTVDGTNNHVMGLANKDWTPGVTQAVSGRAATEDQLQKVSDAVGAGWKVNTGKVTGSTGESNGAASTKVASGEEVQFQAGNNLIVDQNGKTVAYSLNKALKDLEFATFNGTGTNKTVINGDSITQTAGTQTNTSTAAGNTVADGTKSTETTAAGQVIKDGAKSNKSTVDNNVIDDGNGNVNTSNATSNTITDGTNTSTVTAGKATIGSSIIDGVNNTFTTGGADAVTLDGATGTITGTTANIGGVTVNGTAKTVNGLSNTTWNGTAVSGRAATEDQLKAVGEQTWQITADKDTATSGAQTGTKKDAKVGKDDKVQLIAGENMTVNQNERDFTFTLNKDLVKMNSATFLGTGTNKTVITGDSITQTSGTQTNTSTAGGNTVADGTKSTETTAAGQVIKDGTKSNKSTVDNNVIDDGTGNVNTSNATSNTVTDGTNTTEATASTLTVKDNAGNSTVITKDNITTGVGGKKITLDGTAGKATIGSSIIDGVNKTFTTGGTNAVTMNGAAGTVKTGTVTVTGGTTNDITGLSNTTVNSADFATKGRAATEEQLKAVGEQTWQITADKDATTSGARTGTKKDAKVGKDNKVQLIAGENMTINQNERDFTFTLNKDLVKMNSATFLGTGSNTTVITGNSITQTAGTQTNTSTAAGNTVADGTKSTETTAAGQVIKDGAKTNKSTVDTNVIDDGNGNKNTSNATSNTITDGTNTSTITAGKANIGNIAVDGVNNKITMGNGATPVTLDGANGHLDGLTNTTWVPGVTKATTGRAATEDQLQQVSDAVGAGWKVNTGTVAGSSGVSNGAASTKVSSGEEVKLQAGDNLVIDQNGKTVSCSLNKDLTKMNSATFEATGGKTTVIKGDSIVQTDGSKTNTSNAAGNTVVDGNKSTATTAAGTTITDGAKTNTSTADKNAINDGSGNTNTATATSNTLKNASGDETKADAKGVTVKDAAGNNATFNKDGITITKTGKDTVSLTSNGLDNGKNKIVNVAAGVANTDAVNVGQLKEYAAKSTTELTANNGETAGSTTGNIVLTKTTAADGHTIYDNKLNDKITLGTDPTKAVTVDGTTGTVTGLTNKTWTPGSIVSGRAATEDQLKDAVADSGWKVAVGKDGSGKSNVVGTSPEKIKAEETVTFKAGNNMMVTQTGKSISYAVNPELTNMTSATFTDSTGNTTVMNSNGITIMPSGANPTNPYAGPVSLTKDGLNNGNNQIKGVAPGTDPTDAVNVAQLNASNANTSQAINQVAGEVQRVGAHAAAMAALKPIQYDPLEPTQVMAGVGNYRGETAAALGLAHYTNENTMFNVGVSVGGNHNMVNAGVTHKFGYSQEKKNIPDRYKAGPISSVYVMQDEVSSLKKENAEQKYVIADQAARLTTLEAENEQQRRELAETKKGLDDLKAAVDKLLASKG
ncbi:YadA-like family protein [Veillonella atypica]|uniref:YadA-like family protein n=1 Tax=Veillonella atypica TaxID=39777 RepID=UPI0019613D52|nr:YadA-like family protein [Veillonella atypica]VTY43042.1 Adhesin Ata autotransporter [Veillonella atypica]